MSSPAPSYKEAFHSSPIPSVLVSPTAHVLAVNESFLRLTAKPVLTLDGSGSLERIWPIDFTSQLPQLRSAIASAAMENIERNVTLRRGSGSLADIMVVTITPIPIADSGESGDVSALLCAIQESRQWIDPLTGFMTRPAFLKGLQSRSKPSSPCPFLFIGLDHFKIANAGGYEAGDRLLQAVAHMLEGIDPAVGMLTRLGGDEFGLVLRDASEEVALAVAETIRQKLKLIETAVAGHGLVCSIGIAMMGTKPSLAVQQAEAACHLAKAQGGDRILSLSDDSLLDSQRSAALVLASIKRALAENRIELYLQRIEALAQTSEADERYEVLIRLRNDEGDLVMPLNFLPVAERFGLMPAIDRYVVRHAFAFLAANAPRQLSISINLSGASIDDCNFVSYILNEAAKTRIVPSAVCFEITETYAISDLAAAEPKLSELRKQGFRFALDDFGKGMSSFSYLQGLPVDYLKIDGSFVRTLLTSETNQAIVSAIVAVAKTMGIQTIAEYVENDDLRQELANIGVDYGQGYGIHKPAPLPTLDHRSGTSQNLASVISFPS